MFTENSLLSVMVVEDDHASRRALVRLLTLLNFATHAASTLGEARSILATQTPNIVILDLKLPDGKGVELLREIRAASLPIIVAVVTAVNNSLRLHEVTALEPDALFGKPIDIDDFKVWLLKQLSECADSSRTPIHTLAASKRPAHAVAC